ncbi:unnamed protein product [Rotaria sp. Silwood2]|nr:unnamed protein product [Rotaria sp. Silwood2]CAF2576468.1 unnamed protein product [Rotaria sp. Silwood2]
MNLVVDFVFNEFDDNLRMALNKVFEIEVSDDSEATTAGGEEDLGLQNKPTTGIKGKIISSSKSKRRCTFNQKWLKDLKYAVFIRECRTNKYSAHCSICKSDFSISNGDVYLINHHIEQSSHKRLAETPAKENSRSIHDFIPASSTLTKLTAAELSLVYHGVRRGYSYLSQSCTVDLLKKIFNDSQIGQIITCGKKTKARELSVNVLRIIKIDQITFDQIERCVAILHIELNHDKLFDEMIHIQSTFKEIVSYRESLSDQIQKYIGNRNFNEVEETAEEERFFHKTTTSNHQHNHRRIRPDQLWAYLISRATTNLQEITKLISFVYSIPCSNAFTEGVFNPMKQAWIPSRNLMSVETIAAELQIRLNGQMKCDDFFIRTK